MSCTKLQLPPEPLKRRLPPPDPPSPCPQLNLVNRPPIKIPGYATGLLCLSATTRKLLALGHITDRI